MLIVVPLLVSASLFSYGLDQVFRYDLPPDGLPRWMIITGLSVYFGRWVIACGARWVARRMFWRRCEVGPASWVILPTAFVTGAVCGLLFLPYAQMVNGQATYRTMMGLWKRGDLGGPRSGRDHAVAARCTSADGPTIQRPIPRVVGTLGGLSGLLRGVLAAALSYRAYVPSG